MNGAILIIDDSVVARSLASECLVDAGITNRILLVEDADSGLGLLRSEKIDLILCDLKMPGIDGLEMLQRLQADPTLCDIPVIMLTGDEAREDKIRGLEIGASDYVTKPFDAAELSARVKVQLKIKSLQDSLRASNERLQALANTDELTGLSNRRNLFEFLPREIQRSSRTGDHLSLAMIDLDHFKKVNDTYGHQQGDFVLQRIAALLLRNSRPYDLAARFGGEEFALVLPETSLASAAKISDRLREEVQRMTYDAPLENLQQNISIGVAALPHSRISDIDSLIREADDALYRAKRNGRNRVELMVD